MKSDGRVTIGAILGKKSEDFYVSQIADFLYFVRSLALVDMKSDEEKIREKIQSIGSVLLQKTVKFFLIDKYGTMPDGTIRVSVTEKEIRDMKGNIIEEIVKFKENLKSIGEQLLELGSEEFEKGRKIALEITQRIKNSTNAEKRRILERDFNTTPPMEMLEIEMLRLERKLPFLSQEEGKRLVSLYDQWHHLESDKEVYMENV